MEELLAVKLFWPVSTKALIVLAHCVTKGGRQLGSAGNVAATSAVASAVRALAKRSSPAVAKTPLPAVTEWNRGESPTTT